jgi:hypothetical protein
MNRQPALVPCSIRDPRSHHTTYELLLAGYYQPITQWSKGEYVNANNVRLHASAAAGRPVTGHGSVSPPCAAVLDLVVCSRA